MENIQEKLKILKNKINIEKNIDEKLKTQINQLLCERFNDKTILAKYLKDIYVKNNTLFISVQNKSLANEIFLARENILKNIGSEFKIKDIFIN